MKAEHQTMIDELQANENAGLTGWEMDLIERLDGLERFSAWEKDKIEEIWGKVFGG